MSTRHRLVATLATGGLLAGATACGGTEQEAGPATDDDLLTIGAEVYGESCASCHGADLRGTDQGPSHLSIVYEPNHHPDEAFRSAIANGAPQHHWPFGDMPPVEGLSNDDVDAVIAFIRGEQQRLGFEE